MPMNPEPRTCISDVFVVIGDTLLIFLTTTQLLLFIVSDLTYSILMLSKRTHIELHTTCTTPQR